MGIDRNHGLTTQTFFNQSAQGGLILLGQLFGELKKRIGQLGGRFIREPLTKKTPRCLEIVYLYP